MALLLIERCNVYGAETGGIARGKALGGLAQGNPVQQFYCSSRAVGRFIMECEHGHKGQVMPLCGKHVTQYGGGRVTFCPACNSAPPGHKCALRLVEKS